MSIITEDSRNFMKTNPHSTYISLSREEWSSLYTSPPIDLSQIEIKNLQGIVGTLTKDEIYSAYLPLIQYLSVLIQATNRLHKARNEFFKMDTKKLPFIIGVAGSVAVGKSTTSRIIQSLLSNLPDRPKVDLVTTDGFLYSNAVLKEKGLSDRKGFPESYDLKALLDFLTEIKSGNPCVQAPVYSHLHYDIMPDEYYDICQPDIVIIEGINVLQTPKPVGDSIPSKFVSDFFDISIYVDANEHHIRQWYLERFKLLKETAFTKPESYFHRYATLTDTEAEEFATDIWNRINKVNLEENILPTKFRADIIMEKNQNHQVQMVRVRKI
ncbi:type I pantothenate kinase [Ornithinibacillus sp. BX22]|uniref:Pantothenate kinase n=1 Tax=Ornithinibacillus hominis TaxID=2763055 RepID=A0A923L2Q1_9BACI|nr:type I pantothenate kinase [Ornithinibacillus hominis]MBC5635366.1 type I pantothenate kinase [Ornithinibacillus hominis]